MSIGTQTGDAGVETCGTVDELVAQVGRARGPSAEHEAASIARGLQRDLFAVTQAEAWP